VSVGKGEVGAVAVTGGDLVPPPFLVVPDRPACGAQSTLVEEDDLCGRIFELFSLFDDPAAPGMES